MRNAVSLFFFCACAAVVSGSGVKLSTVRVGVFVTLTCEDLGPHRQAVLNATVEAAVTQITHDSRLYRSNLSVAVDVFDICLADGVTRIISALENSSSFYIAIAGPGLYSLCGIASGLQNSKPVHKHLHQSHFRHCYHHIYHDKICSLTII